MKVSTLLDQIDLGAVALPEFQRGYVWNRDQVRSLMDSLYRKHPVGSLLVWVTKTEEANARGESPLAPGSVKLLLDGQQRVTTLYGIIRGRAPAFFNGNVQTFTGLYFNIDTKTFEFYGPIRMKDQPQWISVTELMQKGVGEFIKGLFENPELQPKMSSYITKLNAIDSIKETDFHVDEVTGDDKNVDVVVDIFNKVNSGGTKLSKGDLALAKICGQWPDARKSMQAKLAKWRNAGFHFKLEWLLRCVNAVATGEARFAALHRVDVVAFQQSLERAERSIDILLNLISGRLGLDQDRVLGSHYSFPLMARYLVDRGGNLTDHRQRDRLLYWYIHTFLWGRYAGSTETVLDQDLAAIESRDDRLVELLRRSRGDLRLTSNDFLGWSTAARFYPLLYMLTRVQHARDWDTGVELSNQMLGKLSGLQVHHIFPKALLYKAGYKRAEANAVANFTFLTQETNLKISDHDPAVYLAEFAGSQPGAIESHWIPMDRDLWRIDRYRDFLSARRELPAEAANRFLDSLVAGSLPQVEAAGSVLDREAAVPRGIMSPEEEELLINTNIWIVEQGLPEGTFSLEIADELSGEAQAIIDLAWPDGIQEGFSDPVALMIDEDAEVERIASRAGYRVFTEVEAFRSYICWQPAKVGHFETREIRDRERAW